MILETSKLVVYVAALTYKRPEGLSMLLEAFNRLEIPDSADVHFLIVDNDPGGSAREIVERHSSGFENTLAYVVEPEPGIPAGRNRALTEASIHGADYLCFTDDDAMPDRHWIQELLRHQSETGAVITLGPTVLLMPRNISGLFRRFLAQSLVARSHLIARHVERASRNSKIFFGATSNLMMDVSWVKAHEVRFCTSRVESGGSDSEFIENVRQNNGMIAWCSKAFVRETLPPERAEVKYQFRRSRSHGLTFSKLPNKGRVRLLRIPGARLVVGFVLMVIPALGIASFSLGLHYIGMEVGRIEGWIGRRSRLYAR